jgi:hypothetical protein
MRPSVLGSGFSESPRLENSSLHFSHHRSIFGIVEIRAFSAGERAGFFLRAACHGEAA